MKRVLAASAFACCFDLAMGQTALCEVDYGGETHRFAATPTTAPYQVPTQAVGSYFLFRLVFEADTAVKVYVFADREKHNPLPLHQAVYPLPLDNKGPYGFSGLHFVYEPLRDGELAYWCALY